MYTVYVWTKCSKPFLFYLLLPYDIIAYELNSMNRIIATVYLPFHISVWKFIYFKNTFARHSLSIKIKRWRWFTNILCAILSYISISKNHYYYLSSACFLFCVSRSKVFFRSIQNNPSSFLSEIGHKKDRKTIQLK